MAFSLSDYFGGLTMKQLAVRVYDETFKDDVFGRAAQLAYYFLLALFPLLLFLISILGAVVGENSQMQADLFRYLGNVLPSDAGKLVQETVRGAIEASGGGKISFGILAAIWAASNGVGAICDSLNIAYGVKETRPWWKGRLVSVGLTIALAVLIITALILVLAGHDIADVIARRFGLSQAFEVVWGIIQYPIIIAFVLLAFALIFYFAPNLEKKSWKWITPGAFIGVALWLAVSYGFSLYLKYFNSYSKTYGALGAVIILMLWFYLSGIAILVGGEINSEVEKAAAERGDPTAKAEGERAPGDKSAELKDAPRSSNYDDNDSPSGDNESRKDNQSSDDTVNRKTTKQPSQTAAARFDSSNDFSRNAPTANRPAIRNQNREPLSISKVALVAASWFLPFLRKKK